MVYVSIKEDPTGESYESEKSLITHVWNIDTWIIGSKCSHHMNGNIDLSLKNLKKLMMGELLS